jgi:hypothetical protein
MVSYKSSQNTFFFLERNLDESETKWISDNLMYIPRINYKLW